VGLSLAVEVVELSRLCHTREMVNDRSDLGGGHISKRNKTAS
jgi:hypothetical protein